MIAKRTTRSPSSPSAGAGVLASSARSAHGAPPPGNKPVTITRELAKSILAPSGWDVLSSQLPVMAAALAYRTIFGLVPMLVIGLMVIGAYAQEKEISAAVSRLLHYAGLDQVALETGEPSDAEAVRDLVGGSPPESSGTESTGASQRLDEWISGLVTQVRSIPFRTIGIVGLIALIYAAVSMLVEIERAFNQIYRVPAGRSWWSRITRYWTLLTLGSIGLFVTFYATDAFLSRIDQVDSWTVSRWMSGATPPDSSSVAPSGASPEVAGAASAAPPSTSGTPSGAAGARSPSPGTMGVKAVMGYAVTVLISTGFLTIIYSVVPNARVRLLSAISGAFVAALLWEAAKWGFAYYVKSAFFTKIYGALALLPLFLLWIYIAWMIVLLGLFICHRLQTRGTSLISVFGDGKTSIVDPASVVVVAAAVAREFKSGRSMSATDVARVTGLEQGVAVSMLEALVSHGLVHHVSTGNDEDRYALAKPPESIPVGDCLAAGCSLADPGDSEAIRGRDTSLVTALRPLEEARAAATRGRTLADFLDTSAVQSAPSPSGPPPVGEAPPGPAPAASAG